MPYQYNEILKTEWERANKNLRGILACVQKIDKVMVSGKTFIKILKRANDGADKTKEIDRRGSLVVQSRRRLTIPYHLVLRPYASKQWFITYPILQDAINFAIESDFLVSFSTIKSGAGDPLDLHFQALPKKIEWGEEKISLFESLISSKPTEIYQKRRDEDVSLCELKYNIPVFKLSGKRTNVCYKLFTLCLAYDALKSFNLIITSNSERLNQTIDTYFIPRRFDGLVVPVAYRNEIKSFGACEMAGVFPFSPNQSQLYKNANAATLKKALREVAIKKDNEEYHRLKNLCINL